MKIENSDRPAYLLRPQNDVNYIAELSQKLISEK
jgi:hypothetical protein